MYKDTNEYRKFDIWMADLSLTVGSEQGGQKTVMIISNNIGNRFAPVVTVCVVTSRTKNPLPIHVHLNADLNGLKYDSTALLEQIRTIDKNRLMYKVATVHESMRKEINNAIKVSLDTEEEVIYVDRTNEHNINICFA